LRELLTKKQAGEKIEAPQERAPSKVVNLMDALRRSIEAEGGKRAPAPSVEKREAKKKRVRSGARKTS
jgi:DNA end-binding protein Ku